MLPYIILIILALLCASTDVSHVKNRIVITLPFFLVMFSMAAFRDHIAGFDYHMYELYYTHVVGIGDYLRGLYEPFYRSKSFESGFVILSSVIRTLDFTQGPCFFFFMIALVSFSIFFPSIKEYTPFVYIAILFYLYKAYFWHDFTLARQTVAIAVFTYSIRYVLKREYWKYIALNLIAMSLHASAIILLPLCFILNRQFSIRTILITIFVAFVISFLSPFLWQMCINIATVLGIGERLTAYNMNTNTINPLNFLEIVFILFVSLFNRKMYTEKEPYFNIFLNMFLISSVLVIAFSSFEIFARFKEFFVISYMVLISYFIGHVKSTRSRWAAFLILSIYVMLGYFRYIIIFDDGDLIPYRWVL